MTITTLDLDPDVLATVMRLSGKRTKKDAVNEALREYAERHARIAALEQFAAEAKNWDYDSWRTRHESEKSGNP